jgi:hypothetical protein
MKKFFEEMLRLLQNQEIFVVATSSKEVDMGG